jgi:fructoselysine-6-P-deglycase FrlB-like protein
VTVDPSLFLADLEAKPRVLRALADHLAATDPWATLPADTSRVVFVGMGSSAYAAGVAAARLRARGIDAVAELASSDLLPALRPGTAVIAVSAGGGSRETTRALAHYAARGPITLLTNTPDSPLAADATEVVPLRAEPEAGGVACRSYQHTIALLLALERRLLSPDLDVAALVRRAADASEDLLERRDTWLDRTYDVLAGPHGTHVAAPARRLSSAQQSALMLREGPRIPSVGCETGDWSHVDVYLTKTTDYRLLLLAGSRWEDELLRWCRERGSTIVAVGDDVPDTAYAVRYQGDGDDEVRLLTETLVAELLAARLWSERS